MASFATQEGEEEEVEEEKLFHCQNKIHQAQYTHWRKVTPVSVSPPFLMQTPPLIY